MSNKEYLIGLLDFYETNQINMINFYAIYFFSELAKKENLSEKVTDDIIIPTKENCYVLKKKHIKGTIESLYHIPHEYNPLKIYVGNNFIRGVVGSLCQAGPLIMRQN